MVINCLDAGSCRPSTTHHRSWTDSPNAVVWKQTHELLLRDAQRLRGWRRGLGSTGAHSVDELVRFEGLDRYSVRPCEVARPQLRALAMDEPPADTRVVQMLEALSLEESQFYANEKNVIEPEGKSVELFHEIEEHYGFVGGAKEEYTGYLARPECQPLWHWELASDARAFAGISATAKKDSNLLRKLLMQCASNYWWRSVKERADHGLHGGEALARTHVASDHWSIAALDQSVAFTSVETPRWMWRWCTAPPLLAADVWRLRATIQPWNWVAPSTAASLWGRRTRCTS